MFELFDSCSPGPLAPALSLADRVLPDDLVAAMAVGAASLDRDVVDALAAVSAVESRVAAHKARLIAELVRRQQTVRPGGTEVDPVQCPGREQVATALKVSCRSAQIEVDHAQRLMIHPATLAALSDGAMTTRAAKVMITQTLDLSAEQIGVVEADVVDYACTHTPAEVKRRINRTLHSLLPREQEAQQVAAAAGREVAMYPGEHGMAVLEALLPCHEANLVFGYLNRAADTLKAHDREQLKGACLPTNELASRGTYRADALVALIAAQWTSPATSEQIANHDGFHRTTIIGRNNSQRIAVTDHDRSDKTAGTNDDWSHRLAGSDDTHSDRSTGTAHNASQQTAITDDNKCPQTTATNHTKLNRTVGIGYDISHRLAGSNPTHSDRSTGTDHDESRQTAATDHTKLNRTIGTDYDTPCRPVAIGQDNFRPRVENGYNAASQNDRGWPHAGDGGGAIDGAAVIAGEAAVRDVISAGTIVNIVMDLPTALGLADNPAELRGYGPIPGPLARELATDATWRRWITDERGTLTAVGTSRYKPPDALREFVIARDQRCRFPGCHQPAQRCDIDHAIPYEQGGHTEVTNLGALCRRHHRIKTSGGWDITDIAADGTYTWTTPTGERVRQELEPLLPDTPTIEWRRKDIPGTREPNPAELDSQARLKETGFPF